MPRRIGLAVLDYDQASITRRCLRSVAAGKRRPDEIVLVENGEKTVDLESDAALAELGVRVLHPGGNLGVAGGRNLAINHLVRNSDVERLVVLDNDTTVPSDFFARVADASLEQLEVAAPLVLDMDSNEVIYAGGEYDGRHVPTVISEWPDGAMDPREVDWAPGAGLVLDRKTWLHVGEFDDRYYAFAWEDIEWCVRAVRLGAVIRVEPQVRAIHDAHQSGGGPFSTERVRQWARNGTIFMFETTGSRQRLHWLSSELGRIVHELRAGARWRPVATARIRGLAQGLREVGRRRLGRGRTAA